MREQERKTETNRLQIQVHNIENKQKESYWSRLKLHLLQHKFTVTMSIFFLPNTIYHIKMSQELSLFFFYLFYLGTCPTRARKEVEPTLQT